MIEDIDKSRAMLPFAKLLFFISNPRFFISNPRFCRTTLKLGGVDHQSLYGTNFFLILFNV